MIYTIEHEIPASGARPGRMRLRCADRFTSRHARLIGALLETQDGTISAEVSARTGSILIYYEDGYRDAVLKAADIIDETWYGDIAMDDEPEEPRSLISELIHTVARIALCSLLPVRIKNFLSAIRTLPLLMKGAKSLFVSRRFNVSVLDASAVSVSMLRGDFRTASVITNLLAVGDILEDWTRKRSRSTLADGLALHVDKLWVRRGDTDELIPMAELAVGDLVVVRTGSVVPIDGTIESGDAMVDQSSMTGESEPARVVSGDPVYAGTLVEDGEIAVRVAAFDSDTRIQKIAEMIEDAEQFKAGVQSMAERFADAAVPWNFLLAAATWLLTGSAERASAALMVDWSCAIKLAVPLSILSAMREGASHGMLVKGGRCLETLSKADTIVFDKTGTLTSSAPALAKVVPFGDYSASDVLSLAACLEEHFPHSIARAVVDKAESTGLEHPERHKSVEYITAHGIISELDGQELRLGSAHFIFEDSGIRPTPEEQELIERESATRSMLFLAVGDKLAGALCIEDPIRPDARDAVRELRAGGIDRIVMMTGDVQRTADAVGEQVGVDRVIARMLPEDKTREVRSMVEDGRTVIMVGDGINDSPALAAASVGVAMHSGADIARETADVLLSDNSLEALTASRELSKRAMRKIHRSITGIIGANSLLIALGLAGVISPATSALVHNMVTVAAGSYGMMPVLPRRTA